MSQAWSTSTSGSLVVEVPAHSFQSIMDETLALKLQDENDACEYDFVQNDQDGNENENENSQYEKKVQAFSSDEDASAGHDADLALALTLQAQEEEEYKVRKAVWAISTGQTSTGHVSVQYREDPLQAELDLHRLDNVVHNDFEEDIDDDDEEDVEHASFGTTKHNAHLCGKQNAHTLMKHHHVDLDKETIVPNKAFNALKETLRKEGKCKGIKQEGRIEKAKRATSEAVLDERTRLILFKLTNRGELDSLQGVIRTGKEANVYTALRQEPGSDDKPRIVAVKIFQTTLTAFRNRGEYVVGDHRCDQEFNKKSVLGQVTSWAAKEFSNLKRAAAAGLLVPTPLCKKEHVLIMSFIGREKWPAPQLREVELTVSQWQRCYAQIVSSTRLLYQKARLVHADLSAYNLLYGHKQVYWIDFGQAVEVGHPKALEYLTRDIKNISTFFQNKVKDLTEPFLLSPAKYLEFVTHCETKTSPTFSKSLNDLLKKHSALTGGS